MKDPKPYDHRQYDKMLAAKLRYIMHMRGLQIKDVAEMAKIPKGTLYNNFCGKFAFSTYSVAKICTALGLDANEFLGVKR